MSLSTGFKLPHAVYEFCSSQYNAILSNHLSTYFYLCICVHEIVWSRVQFKLSPCLQVFMCANRIPSGLLSGPSHGPRFSTCESPCSTLTYPGIAASSLLWVTVIPPTGPHSTVKAWAAFSLNTAKAETILVLPCHNCRFPW